jgi:hypothetical protein
MNLEGGDPRPRSAASAPSLTAAAVAAAAAVAPAASAGSAHDSAMLCSAEGSPVSARETPQPRQHHHNHHNQPQQIAMQGTPSQSQTPSAKAAPGGGGGQPSVHSTGLRSRLSAQRPTPMRLYDALQLHPTSPSDPGQDSQLDLRKVGAGPGVAAVNAGWRNACWYFNNCRLHGLHLSVWRRHPLHLRSRWHTGCLCPSCPSLTAPACLPASPLCRPHSCAACRRGC